MIADHGSPDGRLNQLNEGTCLADLGRRQVLTEMLSLQHGFRERMCALRYSRPVDVLQPQYHRTPKCKSLSRLAAVVAAYLRYRYNTGEYVHHLFRDETGTYQLVRWRPCASQQRCT